MTSKPSSTPMPAASVDAKPQPREERQGGCATDADLQRCRIRVAVAERALRHMQSENDTLKHREIAWLHERQQLQLVIAHMRDELEEMSNTVLQQTVTMKALASQISRRHPCQLIKERRASDRGAAGATAAMTETTSSASSQPVPVSASTPEPIDTECDSHLVSDIPTHRVSAKNTTAATNSSNSHRKSSPSSGKSLSTGDSHVRDDDTGGSGARHATATPVQQQRNSGTSLPSATDVPPVCTSSDSASVRLRGSTAGSPHVFAGVTVQELLRLTRALDPFRQSCSRHRPRDDLPGQTSLQNVFDEDEDDDEEVYAMRVRVLTCHGLSRAMLSPSSTSPSRAAPDHVLNSRDNNYSNATENDDSADAVKKDKTHETQGCRDLSAHPLPHARWLHGRRINDTKTQAAARGAQSKDTCLPTLFSVLRGPLGNVVDMASLASSCTKKNGPSKHVSHGKRHQRAQRAAYRAAVVTTGDDMWGGQFCAMRQTSCFVTLEVWSAPSLAALSLCVLRDAGTLHENTTRQDEPNSLCSDVRLACYARVAVDALIAASAAGGGSSRLSSLHALPLYPSHIQPCFALVPGEDRRTGMPDAYTSVKLCERTDGTSLTIANEDRPVGVVYVEVRTQPLSRLPCKGDCIALCRLHRAKAAHVRGHHHYESDESEEVYGFSVSDSEGTGSDESLLPRRLGGSRAVRGRTRGDDGDGNAANARGTSQRRRLAHASARRRRHVLSSPRRGVAESFSHDSSSSSSGSNSYSSQCSYRDRRRRSSSSSHHARRRRSDLMKQGSKRGSIPGTRDAESFSRSSSSSSSHHARVRTNKPAPTQPSQRTLKPTARTETLPMVSTKLTQDKPTHDLPTKKTSFVSRNDRLVAAKDSNVNKLTTDGADGGGDEIIQSNCTHNSDAMPLSTTIHSDDKVPKAVPRLGKVKLPARRSAPVSAGLIEDTTTSEKAKDVHAIIVSTQESDSNTRVPLPPSPPHAAAVPIRLAPPTSVVPTPPAPLTSSRTPSHSSQLPTIHQAHPSSPTAAVAASTLSKEKKTQVVKAEPETAATETSAVTAKTTEHDPSLQSSSLLISPVAVIPPAPPPPPLAAMVPTPTVQPKSPERCVPSSARELRVYVKEGRHLMDSGEEMIDVIGNCNPRVRVWLDDQLLRTVPAVHESVDPHWTTAEGEFVVPLPAQTECLAGVLRFELQDVNVSGIDPMGEARLSVAEVLSSPGLRELTVKLDGVDYGTLMVEFSVL